MTPPYGPKKNAPFEQQCHLCNDPEPVHDACHRQSKLPIYLTCPQLLGHRSSSVHADWSAPDVDTDLRENSRTTVL